MSFFNATHLNIKVGDYATGTASALTDVIYVQTARARRKQIRRSMKALDKEMAKIRIPAGDYHISRKVDGEYTCLVYKDGDVATVNPGGTVRTGATFHKEAAELLKKAGVSKAIIGGELYVKNPERNRPSVHDVVRVARAPKNQADVDQLHFAVFDIYDLDGEDLSIHHGNCLEKIREIFTGVHVHPVESVVDADAQGVLRMFKTWAEDEGEEGVIARSDEAGAFKIKPLHNLDLAVVGFSEGIDARAGMLHSLLVAVVREDGAFHLVGHVGGGYSDRQRTEILAQLTPQITSSEYVEVNSHHVAYHMIAPGPVIEINCLDVISRSSLGLPLEKMVLEWNVSESKWEPVRRLALASIISPQFQGFRDDKSANAGETGIKQLADITDIPDVDKKADDVKMPKSDVLERIVATKEYRGALMVRKILLWKTNKEDTSPDFPAYVLHLTDYSPSRKDPLKHEIRVSASEEQIRGMFVEWHAKYFVKGWEITSDESSPS